MAYSRSCQSDWLRLDTCGRLLGSGYDASSRQVLPEERGVGEEQTARFPLIPRGEALPASLPATEDRSTGLT